MPSDFLEKMIRKYDFDYSVINKNGFTNYGVASRIAHDLDEKER
jgi:hypothetical protein